MKYLSLIQKIVLVIFLVIEATVYAADQKLPVINGKKTVAMINDEPITLDEFNLEVSSLRASKSAEGKKDGDSELLRRLINTKLIIQEARKIGLDELDEVKNMVDVFSRVTLRELLAERQLKDVKADPKEVEKIYQGVGEGMEDQIRLV